VLVPCFLLFLVVLLQSPAYCSSDCGRLFCFSRVIMTVVRSRCGHYIFALWFLLSSSSSFLFPRLISADGDWMSTIFHTWCGLSTNLECRSEKMCCMRLAGNAGPKHSLKYRYLGTIAQLCRAISSQLRHISTIRKN